MRKPDWYRWPAVAAIVVVLGVAVFSCAAAAAAAPQKPEGVYEMFYRMMGWPLPKPRPPVIVPPAPLPPVATPPAPAPKALPPKGKPKPKAKPKPKQKPPEQQRPTAAQCALARASIAIVGMEATIQRGMTIHPGFTREQVERGLRQCGLLR